MALPDPRSARRLGRAAGIVAGLLTGLAPAAGALDRLDIVIGKALFDRAWVPAPASTRADDGLGPLFDARSCASCHPKDGRAAAAFDGQGHLDGRGVVLMIGAPDGSGDPVYGRRLQLDAIPGLAPEGILGADDTLLPDGLRARRPKVSDLAYGRLAPRSGLSLRVAPDLHGRGAIARVPDAVLLEEERAQAGGKDGVSGRVRRIVRPDGREEIGRFGWKASHPSLDEQIGEAFFLDLGLSNPLFHGAWGDCTPAQAKCRAAPQGGGAAKGGDEIGEEILSRVVAYVASLPPASGAADELNHNEDGARLFAASGCAACHRPALPTGDGKTARLYSDLLLHDMGQGLADGMNAPGVGLSEWRTAPLAGVSVAIARDTGLLHDGRARSVKEAILWHGGEAATAAARFKVLPEADRAALLAYVSSL